MDMNMINAAVFLLYNLLLEIVYYILYPFLAIYLPTKGYLSSIKDIQFDFKNGILIHTASVGEVNAVKTLILELVKRYPDTQITITTTSISGLKIAQTIHPSITVKLSPLDIYHLRQKQFHNGKPALIIIVETEIWPNLLYIAKQTHIPVVFVNARLTEKSLQRMKPFRSVLRYLAQPIVSICAQSEVDKQRFQQIFSNPVHNAGNLKFATQLPDYEPITQRTEWGYCETDFIVTIGSSRPGEETLMREIYLLLKQFIPNLKLIVAIRHINRVEDIVSVFEGIKCSRLSASCHAENVFIIDEMGYLNRAYAISDIAIVGGSFYDFGGHNPLEPAYYAKPIIMGKFHSSCRDSVNKLTAEDAIMISDPEHLAEAILNLYYDKALRNLLASNAKRVLTQNASSLDYHLKEIEKNWKHV